MKKDKLTPKQEKFCQEYVANGGNASGAYRTAYNTKKMKPQSVNRNAFELMQDTKIASRIHSIRERIEEESNVSAVWVRQRLIELVDRCMQAEAILNAEGEPTGEYRFDSSGANKAIDTINRMQGYYEKDNNQSKANIIEKIEVRFI